MKRISRGIPHEESTKRRRLQLSKEAIKTLRAADLTAVYGGCDTTSYTTERTNGTASGAC